MHAAKFLDEGVNYLPPIPLFQIRSDPFLRCDSIVSSFLIFLLTVAQPAFTFIHRQWKRSLTLCTKSSRT